MDVTPPLNVVRHAGSVYGGRLLEITIKIEVDIFNKEKSPRAMFTVSNTYTDNHMV